MWLGMVYSLDFAKYAAERSHRWIEHARAACVVELTGDPEGVFGSRLMTAASPYNLLGLRHDFLDFHLEVCDCWFVHNGWTGCTWSGAGVELAPLHLFKV